MPAAKPALFCGATTSRGCVLVGHIDRHSTSAGGHPDVTVDQFHCLRYVQESLMRLLLEFPGLRRGREGGREGGREREREKRRDKDFF